MKFHKTPIALAVLAACSAAPLAAQAAPTVSWAAPLDGATLKGTLSGSSCAAATSSDATRVTFWADNWQINNDYSPPFNCSFDTTRLADGNYTLRAVAYDASGAASTSQINVTIANSGSTASSTSTSSSISTSSSTSTTSTSTTATPAPGSGSLDVWFKAPLSGSTLKGVLNGGTSCYVNGTSVSRVAFFMDGTALNSDTTMSDGMQCVLDTTKFANGTHQLKAQAFDSSGNSRWDVISVNVQNTATATNAAPTVALTSPANGTTVSGTAVAYAANATDDQGVARVDFSLDGAALLSDTSSPYAGTLDSTKLANGTHTLKAVAYDAQGLSATSQISINVQNTTSTTTTGGTTSGGTTSGGTATSTTATPAPSSGSLDLWFKAPLSGSTIKGVLNGGTSCYVNGTGDVRVAFFLDGTALNTDTSMSDGMQCVIDTTKFANGTHQLKAQGFDSAGNSRWDVITVNVQNIAPNAAPTVSLSSPANGATVSGVALAFAANATDDQGVARVDFFVDSTAIVSDTSAPYSGTLDTTKLANGTHVLKAVAYDAQGLSATSQISINVQNTTSTTTSGGTTSGGTTSGGTTSSGTATPAPTFGSLDLWFKAPAAGATISGTLNGGTSCYVNGVGDVKVAFFLDGTALNTDTSMSDGMQCVIDTTKFANGTHQLKAQGFDSAGNSRWDVISVNVQNTTSTTSGGTTSGGTTSVGTTSGGTTSVGTTSGGTSSGGTSTTPSSSTLPANGARAVPTFHSIGLYWTPPSNPGAGCPVIFRKAGDSAWRQGLDMWYDSASNECRGSLVQLQPGTSYEVQLGMPGQPPSAGLIVNTWSEQYPVAQVITLPAGTRSTPLAITQGGTASGYVVYQADPTSGTTIDVQNQYANNVTISAPYVILRGFTLKGAQADAINLLNGARDLVIEGNDISGWGRYRSTGNWAYGEDYDAGVRCESVSTLERVVVQRNKIHDPRYGANSWDGGIHPAGPQGMSFNFCGGNNVIRYNEVTSSDSKHFYNDGIGGSDNYTRTGFPSYDTDIYGNVIQGVMDDGIEAEGGNRNVRIWGNYLDQTATGIASTIAAVGPVYIFRNVYNRSRFWYLSSTDSDDRGPFFKSGTDTTVGNGRRYVFHNTSLQPTQPGATYPLGAGSGIHGTGSDPLTNTVSRNNIYNIWKSGWDSVDQKSGGFGNDVDYDLYNGSIAANAGAESNGIRNTPVYASGSGVGMSGMYQLSPSSPGYGAAVRLPNFNDDASTPDMGAHQSGTAAMKFGVNQ